MMITVTRKWGDAIVFTFKSWKEVLQWIMSVNELEYETWSQYDLVLGMVDYTMEYMRVC